MSDLEAIHFLGNKAELFAFTGHKHVVVNSFGQPVIQHPDAASTVVEICDWVFRHEGRLYACPDELWPVFGGLIAEVRQLREQRDLALDAARTAQLFHEAYERLAPAHGYATREASAKPWSEVPGNNRALMVATCREVMNAIYASSAQPSNLEAR